MTRILRGPPIAQKWRERLAHDVTYFCTQTSRKPHLCIVRIGERPESLLYIQRKKEACAEIGIEVTERTFPENVSQEELQRDIQFLNEDKCVHGIIVQLPLPKQISLQETVETVSPQKDVDGLHPLNRGRRYSQHPAALTPCTPWGCLALLEGYGYTLLGENCLVIGRSNLVGRPLAALLLANDATVTVAHSQTKDLPAHISQNKFIFTAIGRPQFFKGNLFSPHHIVVDVGIHQRAPGCVVGDVDFESTANKVEAISPVPKGVGPMTVTGLLHNTLMLAYHQCNLSFPT
jgi:methylenetetrahydrofolate dehydrogenase (NADP+)/methenyltetrahydrofolate cyclohydrolase